MNVMNSGGSSGVLPVVLKSGYYLVCAHAGDAYVHIREIGMKLLGKEKHFQCLVELPQLSAGKPLNWKWTFHARRIARTVAEGQQAAAVQLAMTAGNLMHGEKHNKRCI
ncbi:hypothetical protein MMC07_006564 [Pseudocyphellaria aurata]|nr:hypothetical protein [Pseudocyphellaria aurata]